jgi:Xaa-Pro dipeptidase
MESGSPLRFDLTEYRQRLASLRGQIAAMELDGLLVFWPENIYYLSGYETPGYYAFQCLVVLVDAEPFFVVRHLEATNVEGRSWLQSYVGYQDGEDPVTVLKAECERRGLARGRLGIERDAFGLSATRYAQIAEALRDVELVDGSGMVERLRLIKSAREIGYIRLAARAAESAMQAAIDQITIGASENTLAAAAYHAAILEGSEYPSLPAFVTSGPLSSLAHATWSGRKLVAGDLVYLEISGVVARYSAALMRTASIGEPSSEVKRRASVIIEALESAIAIIRPGATSGQVDHAARSIMEKGGIGHLFRHRTGYSIGVNFPPDWGEGHILSLRRDDKTVLEEGMVFHMPPGILDVGRYGLGFSETVLVTGHGSEVLTSFPRHLVVR